jgi:nucleotide-binding universal stress UspA family protein
MKTMLVPVDFSDVTPDLLDAAAAQAGAFGSKIVLLHVAAPEPEFIGYDPGPQSVRDHVARQLAHEHQQTHNLQKQLAAKGLEATALAIQGYPVDVIIAEAEKLKADLIIMGSHGHGALHNLLVGSVTEGVIRHAKCPLLIIPAHPKTKD